VWLAYAATAATDEKLAAASAQLDADLRAWFTTEFDTLARIGLINFEADAETRAAQALALIDGVTVPALPLPLDQRHSLVTRILDTWLAPLLYSIHDPRTARWTMDNRDGDRGGRAVTYGRGAVATG